MKKREAGGRLTTRYRPEDYPWLSYCTMARGKRKAENISFHQDNSRKGVITKTMSQRYDTILSDSV